MLTCLLIMQVLPAGTRTSLALTADWKAAVSSVTPSHFAPYEIGLTGLTSAGAVKGCELDVGEGLGEGEGLGDGLGETLGDGDGETEIAKL
jgi:hypothetical protein